MRKIPISGKNGAGLFALVDDADYEALSRRSWYGRRTKSGVYACCRIANGGVDRRLSMQAAIMLPPEGMVVDHNDRDTLNNQRQNLRIVTRGQNQMNARTRPGTSRFKGVHAREYASGKKVYRASIRHKSKLKNLGTFRTAEAAARAYDEAAREIFGDYAALNFARDGEASALFVPDHADFSLSAERVWLVKHKEAA